MAEDTHDSYYGFKPSSPGSGAVVDGDSYIAVGDLPVLKATDWDDTEYNVHIRNLWPMVQGLDPDAIDLLATQWRTIGGHLITVRQNLSLRTGQLWPRWEGPAAREFFRQAGGALWSLDEWIAAAINNGSTIHQLAKTIKKNKPEVKRLYDEWIKTSARERKRREDDAALFQGQDVDDSAWLLSQYFAGFDQTKPGRWLDRHTSDFRRQSDVDREYTRKALPHVRDIAQHLITAGDVGMSAPGKYKGPVTAKTPIFAAPPGPAAPSPPAAVPPIAPAIARPPRVPAPPAYRIPTPAALPSQPALPAPPPVTGPSAAPPPAPGAVALPARPATPHGPATPIAADAPPLPRPSASARRPLAAPPSIPGAPGRPAFPGRTGARDTPRLPGGAQPARRNPAKPSLAGRNGDAPPGRTPPTSQQSSPQRGTDRGLHGRKARRAHPLDDRTPDRSALTESPDAPALGGRQAKAIRNRRIARSEFAPELQGPPSPQVGAEKPVPGVRAPARPSLAGRRQPGTPVTAGGAAQLGRISTELAGRTAETPSRTDAAPPISEAQRRGQRQPDPTDQEVFTPQESAPPVLDRPDVPRIQHRGPVLGLE